MKKFKQQHSIPSPEFKLNLVIPRKTYAPGELINFEVIVENPHGVLIEFLTITLLQNMLVVHTKTRKRSSGPPQRSFKFKTEKIAHKQMGPGVTSLSWCDFLKIPSGALPSTVRTTGDLSMEPEQIADVNYYIQVLATQCENYPLISDDFPINIQFPASTARAHDQSAVSGVAGVRRPPRLGRPSQSMSCIEFPRSSSGGGGEESRFSSPRQSVVARLGQSLDPPRYSSLSIDYPEAAAAGTSTSRVPPVRLDRSISQSQETLPPKFEDVVTSYYSKTYHRH